MHRWKRRKERRADHSQPNRPHKTHRTEASLGRSKSGRGDEDAAVQHEQLFFVFYRPAFDQGKSRARDSPTNSLFVPTPSTVAVHALLHTRSTTGECPVNDRQLRRKNIRNSCKNCTSCERLAIRKDAAGDGEKRFRSDLTFENGSVDVNLCNI